MSSRIQRLEETLSQYAKPGGLRGMKLLRYSLISVVCYLEEMKHASYDDWNQETRRDALSHSINFH